MVDCPLIVESFTILGLLRSRQLAEIVVPMLVSATSFVSQWEINCVHSSTKGF